jgi:HK97 family phage major capsid protein
MKLLTPHAKAELYRLNGEIERLCSQPQTRSTRKEIDARLAQMAAIKAAGITDPEYTFARAQEVDAEWRAAQLKAKEAHDQIFRMFLSKAEDADIQHEIEKRSDFLAGQQTISFTAGTQGGMLVPETFMHEVAEGLAAVDPLLDPDVSNVVVDTGFSLKPLQLPGWDLSTIAATKLAEAAQHTQDAVPGTTQKMLNSHTYRLSLSASMEWEDDQAVFARAQAAMARAYGIGFARGIGADLINGNGSTAPAGVLTGASNSGVTYASSGAITRDDLLDIFFSVNKIYRASEKCAWLMADQTYQLVRAASDSNGRPLLDMVADREMLLGKPVYVSPSLPYSNNASVGLGKIVFGDLSHFYVHVSQMHLRRNWQLPGYVEYGKALYTGLMRADSVVHDPTNGAMPPIVYATRS